MRSKRIITLVVCALLATACTGRVNTDPTAALNDLRARAERLRAYADGGIATVDALLAEPLIRQSEKLTKALTDARPIAVAFRDSVVPLAELAGNLTTLDTANKERLRAQLAAVQVAFNALADPLSTLAELIAPLVGQSQNIARIQSYVRLAVVGISIAISVISSRVQ